MTSPKVRPTIQRPSEKDLSNILLRRIKHECGHGTDRHSVRECKNYIGQVGRHVSRGEIDQRGWSLRFLTRDPFSRRISVTQKCVRGKTGLSGGGVSTAGGKKTQSAENRWSGEGLSHRRYLRTCGKHGKKEAPKRRRKIVPRKTDPATRRGKEELRVESAGKRGGITQWAG